MTKLDLPSITRALADERGFHPIYDNNAPDSVKYRGTIVPAGVEVKVELELIGSEVVMTPTIRILDAPPELRFGAPHIESDGKICYASPATYFVDRAYAAASVLGCIEAAENVVSEILAGDSRDDPANEFRAYWLGTPILVDLDLDLGRGTDTTCVGTIAGSTGPRDIVSDNFGALKRRFGQQLFPKSHREEYVARLQSRYPALPGLPNWPPRSMKDLHGWMSRFLPDVTGPLQAAFAEAFDRNQGHLLAIIQSANSLFGFRAPLTKRSAFHSPSTFGSAIAGGSSIAAITKIERLTPSLVTEDFVASRNLPPNQANLAGKKLLLVGCGAVGGFLGTAIARSGAGMKGGHLLLVDYGLLDAGNLGRHALGFRYLNANKAVALCERLKEEFPGINVSAVEKPIQKVSGLLREQELVIDATGTESVADWLSEQFHFEIFPSILHCWVEGNGDAAVAFMEDDKKYACNRCLRGLEPEAASSLMPTDHTVQESTAGGCDGLYVPFSVSSVLHAAALGCELALDWANGRSSPRLRLYYRTGREFPRVDDQDPKKRPGCPLCSAPFGGISA